MIYSLVSWRARLCVTGRPHVHAFSALDVLLSAPPASLQADYDYSAFTRGSTVNAPALEESIRKFLWVLKKYSLNTPYQIASFTVSSGLIAQSKDSCVKRIVSYKLADTLGNARAQRGAFEHHALDMVSTSAWHTDGLRISTGPAKIF